MKTSVVVLAAGIGSRMCSSLPKVLHAVAGKPLLAHVVDAAMQLSPEKIIVVYGKDRPEVKTTLAHLPVEWVEQAEQLGTAHAVQQALPHIPDDHEVLVLYGDVPLLQTNTLHNLLKATNQGVTWLTAELDDPHGLGRIIRDDAKNPLAIVEEKDASAVQRKIAEINTGICVIPAKVLKEALPTLGNDNAQGEFYLTDIFALAVEKNIPLHTVLAKHDWEIQGVNNRIQLSALERIYQMQEAEKLMKSGVTVMDPKRLDVRGNATVGQDTTIDVNVIFEGTVTIGKNCMIGANVHLKNVTIADNVVIKANSMLEESDVAENCELGPFARLRPGTILAKGAKVGNFVEIKKSTIGEGSKVNHLTYIGDAMVGARVNIGAGTITCNYDGANKHQTIIEDDVFVGSNNNLVAPITIEQGATTGSGSTLSKNVPAGKLTVARAKPITLSSWQRPKKK